MTTSLPRKYQYDHGLGQEPEIIDYIKESTVIQSRISPVRCYLLVQTPSGSAVGSASAYMTVSSYVDTTPNYRASIWPSGSVGHPDVRPYTNSGSGSIVVRIDGNIASRVIDVEDIVADNEFAVIKRFDLSPARVELVFNAGFNASLHTIEYYYTTMNQGIDEQFIKSGQDVTETLFGWTQYLNSSCDAFQGKHQVLVRFPISQEDLIVNEEGKVHLEQVDSWMIWEPRVNDYDVLIVTADQTSSGEEERYEIVEKRNSFIQGSLITQRFKLRYIEDTDPRYNISYVTS